MAAYRYVALYNRKGDVVARTKVDADLYLVLSQYRWWRDGCGYARSRDDAAQDILMHRFLLGLGRGDGVEVDHVDRDKLNNTRGNLRLCSHAQNTQNRGANRTYAGVSPSSPYACVYWDMGRGKWRATAKLGGRVHRLGRYETEEDAAWAVERWRRVHKPWAMPDPLLPPR